MNARARRRDDAVSWLVATFLARIGFPVFDRLLRGRISRSALLGAETAYQRGDRAGAGHLLDIVVTSRPGDLTQLARAAALGNALGDSSAARRLCEQALRRDPRHFETQMLLAHLDLPGPNYMEVLRRMHSTLRPRIYVEIGVSAGNSIRLVGPATRAIGVDPGPKIDQPLPRNVQIFALTSDDFFSGPAAQALAGAPIDLAFIDGLHHCEFALRDFMHLERLCARASTVLIHDCYPQSRLTAERERTTAFWTGDVWRMVVALRRHRPDLKVQVIATPPSGLAVIRGLNPASTVLADRYDAIVAEMLALDYAVLDKDKDGMLGRFPNDWERIAGMLAA